MVDLIEIEQIKGGKKPEIYSLLDTIGDILRKGYIDRPVVIDNNYNLVGERDLYWSLKIMGAKLVPATKSKTSTKIAVSLESLGFYDEVKGDPVKVYNSTLELLYRGWPTPIVRLKSLSSNKYRVWAKLEAYNPFSNSVKDRIGWSMVKDYIESRGGTPPEIVYEATSTNTGVALAAMASIYGFKARFYIPMSIQKASDTILKAYGAEVIRVPKSLTIEAIEDVKRDAEKDGAINLNQFYNDANFEVHLRYTAKELDYQLRSSGIVPRGFVVGIGTSGHFSAITIYFRNRLHGSVRFYAVQPAPGDTIPGIRRAETGMKWIEWLDDVEILDIPKKEAIESVLEVARKDGLFIGLSSGAVARGFKKLVERGELEEGDYVLVFPDSGYKYIEQLEQYFKEYGG